jgi:hypothetical protein
MNKILPIILVVVLSGCATSPSTVIVNEFKPDSKNIVLLNSTRWDKLLRMGLASEGFRVLKFSSLKNITIKEADKDISFNEAEARYGIELSWNRLDHCLYNDAVKINAYLEVTDLKTNEVLMYIDRGGWTKTCGMGLLMKGTLFTEIAKELNKHWISNE